MARRQQALDHVSRLLDEAATIVTGSSAEADASPAW